MVDHSQLGGDELAEMVAMLQGGEVINTHGDNPQFTIGVERVDQNIIDMVNDANYKVKDITTGDSHDMNLVIMDNSGEF